MFFSFFCFSLFFLGFFYFLGKAFAVYFVTQWIKGTFPRLRVDQMMQFAWKILVPLVLALVLWQMVAMKLFAADWAQNLAILAGNLIVVAIVLSVLNNYFSRQRVTSKRAFEPKSLIGTMEPVTTSGD